MKSNLNTHRKWRLPTHREYFITWGWEKSCRFPWNTNNNNNHNHIIWLAEMLSEIIQWNKHVWSREQHVISRYTLWRDKTQVNAFLHFPVMSFLFVCWSEKDRCRVLNTACCHTIMQHTFLKYCQYNNKAGSRTMIAVVGRESVSFTTAEKKQELKKVTLGKIIGWSWNAMIALNSSADGIHGWVEESMMRLS